MKAMGVFAVMFYLFARPVCAGDSLAIDAEFREEIVQKVATIMQKEYLFAETGEQMANYIRLQLADGKYNSFSEVETFCKKLTRI